MIARIERLHDLGVVGTNRILQVALAHLLGDEKSVRAVRRARRRQHDRRAALAAALIERGVHVDPSGDGLTLWVPVADEAAAHHCLRGYGITAGSGASCHVSEHPEPHLWFGTASLPDASEQIDALARIIAEAAVCDEPTTPGVPPNLMPVPRPGPELEGGAIADGYDYLHVHGTSAVRK
ncbi:hypothetical protein [Nocardia sp. NPDC005366]|uniref:hypothetical protein n=1 Tax=Nocardia sp. NPDC005366 TaxID=3156878 RepID=UPI0033ADAC18